MDRADTLCPLLRRSRMEIGALEPILSRIEDLYDRSSAHVTSVVHGVLALDVFAGEENQIIPTGTT